MRENFGRSAIHAKIIVRGKLSRYCIIILSGLCVRIIFETMNLFDWRKVCESAECLFGTFYRLLIKRVALLIKRDSWTMVLIKIRYLDKSVVG